MLTKTFFRLLMFVCTTRMKFYSSVIERLTLCIKPLKQFIQTANELTVNTDIFVNKLVDKLIKP